MPLNPLNPSFPLTFDTYTYRSPGQSAMASTNEIEGLGMTRMMKEAQTNQTAHFLLHTSIMGEVKSFVQESVEKAKIRFKSESPPTFTYDVSYTPTRPGRHELSVKVDGVEVNGSPAEMFVYRPPSKLGKSIQVISDPDIHGIVAVAIGPQEKVYVVSNSSQKIFVFSKKQEKIQFGKPEAFITMGSSPRYLAVDDEGNMFVTTDKNELCKINKEGRSISSVTKWESPAGQGWLNDPQGVEVNNKQVYVCNSSESGHGLVVFDTELNFLRSFGYSGHIKGKFSSPLQDVSVDAEGKIYIADCGHNRVQVVDQYGQYLDQFGQEEDEERAVKVQLKEPKGIHVRGEYVYVSDTGNSRIAVFNTSGQFITTFSEYGNKEGQLRRPWGITTDSDGFLYVCDPIRHCVQVF